MRVFNSRIGGLVILILSLFVITLSFITKELSVPVLVVAGIMVFIGIIMACLEKR